MRLVLVPLEPSFFSVFFCFVFVESFRYTSHSDDHCRGLFYRAMIWVYDNHEGFGSLDADDPLAKLVTKSLLKGLSDESQEIRDKLFTFWDSAERLPPQITARLERCLTDLYQPDAEPDWLRYSVYLLIQPTHQSNDFERPFSDTPLQECKFNRLSINPAYQSRSTFTPMFSQRGIYIHIYHNCPSLSRTHPFIYTYIYIYMYICLLLVCELREPSRGRGRGCGHGGGRRGPSRPSPGDPGRSVRAHPVLDEYERVPAPGGLHQSLTISKSILTVRSDPSLPGRRGPSRQSSRLPTRHRFQPQAREIVSRQTEALGRL